jgi:hypothetical protein
MRLSTGLLASVCMVGLIQSFTVQAQAPSSSGSPALTAEDSRLIGQGYKLKYSNGTKVFCRMETDLATRFQKSVCLRAEEIQSRAETAQDSFSAARRTSMPPK